MSDYYEEKYASEARQKGIARLHDFFVISAQIYGYFENWSRKNIKNINKFKILHGIYYKGCKKQADIVKKYKIAKPTLHETVMKMQAEHLIKINADKTLDLTQDGLNKIMEMDNFFENTYKNLVSIDGLKILNDLGGYNLKWGVLVEKYFGKNDLKKAKKIRKQG